MNFLREQAGKIMENKEERIRNEGQTGRERERERERERGGGGRER